MTMYVFVEIFFDVTHLISCIEQLKISSINSGIEMSRISLLGTVQFISNLYQVQEYLMEKKVFSVVSIPQVKPLSAGETLGCTSPIISNVDCYIFVADGRFHLEAAMIRNPKLTAYRYDPYAKVLTAERYDSHTMRMVRFDSIQRAQTASKFGLILGSLGRQGSITKFNKLRSLLQQHGKTIVPFIMAELNPMKMNSISKHHIQVWVQVACPRLSIDWSAGFDRPILTPYELQVALGESTWEEVYPMDYYAH
jgi:2-(3-amino-3-carboxypropyl)histidine synthase